MCDELGHAVEREHVDPRPGDVRHSQADGSRLPELFPAIRPVGLQDGIRATIDWMRSVQQPDSDWR